MDPLQYVRASPQSIPDEHLNPSSEVVRLVHAPAGETIGEGYTCTVHLPSSLPPEDVGMVNLAGQRPSSHSSTAASARASITLGSFALRVTKKGHQADVNRGHQQVRSTSRGRDPSHHTGLGPGSGAGLDAEALPGPSRFGREQTGCPPDR